MTQDITRSNIRITIVVSLIVSTVLTTVSVASIYFALTNRLSLMEQKQNEIAEKLDTLIEKYASVESRYGTMALKVNSLETLQRVAR